MRNFFILAQSQETLRSREIDPKGKMKIVQARKEFEGVISKAINIKGKKVTTKEHGTFKKACGSCNPLLKHFNIKKVK